MHRHYTVFLDFVEEANRVKTRKIYSREAFSLPELAVVIGLIGVLIGLFIPTIGVSMGRAATVVSMSNARQIGLSMSVYADEFSGSLPVLYRPELGFEDEDPPFIYETPWGGIPGFWFAQASYYQLAMADPLPADVVLAPQHPPTATSYQHLFQPSYVLSHTFFAEPRYWNRHTQEGASQWSPQRLDAVRFPSDKGMLVQMARYDLRSQSGGASMACCSPGLPATTVLWSDLSAEMLVVGDLRDGEPNYYYHGGQGYGSLSESGLPILSTKDGVLGRDR